MSYFPFYMDVTDKKWLVVGGGSVAYRKIQVLLQYEVNILVVAPYICEEIKAIKQENSDKIQLRQREFLEQDIQGIDFVIAATHHTEWNEKIAQLCKNNNILVNVVDKKEACSFLFPAIIKQNALTIAISTEGNSPALAAKIKRDLETQIPEDIEKLMEILGKYREYIKREIKFPKQRKKIINEIIALFYEDKRSITAEGIEQIVQKYKTEDVFYE